MEIVFTKLTIKDFEKIKQNPQIHKKVIALLEINPYTNQPSYEKLVGIFNTFSRRINIQHRLYIGFMTKKCFLK